jgi:uncharacterized protein
MNDGEFEWDDSKATTNLLKHGISFDVAKFIFEDPNAIDEDDFSSDVTELRFSTLGSVDGRLLYVIATLRGDIIRIISARRAEAFERRKYYEQNKF